MTEATLESIALAIHDVQNKLIDQRSMLTEIQTTANAALSNASHAVDIAMRAEKASKDALEDVRRLRAQMNGHAPGEDTSTDNAVGRINLRICTDPILECVHCGKLDCDTKFVTEDGSGHTQEHGLHLACAKRAHFRVTTTMLPAAPNTEPPLG